MFLVELITSSFLDLISKQARPECRCKRVLVWNIFGETDFSCVKEQFVRIFESLMCEITVFCMQTWNSHIMLESWQVFKCNCVAKITWCLMQLSVEHHRECYPECFNMIQWSNCSFHLVWWRNLANLKLINNYNILL